MQKVLVTLIALIWLVPIFAQSCSHPGLRRALRVISEYSDLRGECESLDLETGGREDFVYLELDDFPELISFFITEGSEVTWALVIPSNQIDVYSGIREILAASNSFWRAKIDGDGDLHLSRNLEPSSDIEFEAYMLQGLTEALSLYENHALASNVSYPEEAESPRDQIIQGCLQGILRELGDEPLPQDLDFLDFCSCLADEMLLNPQTIHEVFDPSGEAYSLMLESCMGELSYEFEGINVEDFGWGALDIGVAAKRGFMNGCLREIAPFYYLEGIGGPEQGEAYCECLYEQMQDMELIDWEDFDDVDGIATTEFDAACGSLLMMETARDLANYWNPSLQGCYGKLEVPFLLSSTGEIRVKVRFGSTEKYMTLDSGCDEVIINNALAKSLKLQGIIGSGDYLGMQSFYLADNSEVMVERYKVSSFQVGACSQSDFIVGVVEEGGMLLGMGFLGLFDRWELDQTKQALILTNH